METKIYQFKEHNLIIQGEEQDILYLAELLREAEGTVGDLRYKIEYAFDIDGVRSCNTEDESCNDTDYAKNYLVK